jgi:hypothetical protein
MDDARKRVVEGYLKAARAEATYAMELQIKMEKAISRATMYQQEAERLSEVR